MAKNSTSSKNKGGCGSKWKYQTHNTVKLGSLNSANSNSMHYFMDLFSPNDCIVINWIPAHYLLNSNRDKPS